MKFIIPIILTLVGAVGGLALGVMLKPKPADMGIETADAGPDKTAHGGQDTNQGKGEDKGEDALRIEIEAATDSVYYPLERRMLVPFERTNGVMAFATVEVTLELPPDGEHLDFITAHEPKVHDALFRVLVGFAATGAFEESERVADTLRELDDAMEAAASGVMGEHVRGVLIANLLTNDA